VPIPTIGARGRIALADFIGMIGRIGYMEYDSNHFLDAEAQVEFSPLPAVGLYAGYRYFDLKIDESDLFVGNRVFRAFWRFAGAFLIQFDAIIALFSAATPTFLGWPFCICRPLSVML
jgi:hypothetical protein